MSKKNVKQQKKGKPAPKLTDAKLRDMLWETLHINVNGTRFEFYGHSYVFLGNNSDGQRVIRHVPSRMTYILGRGGDAFEEFE